VRKGEKMSAEMRAKISAALKGNQNSLGHKDTPEMKAKKRAAMMGNQHALGAVRTPEWRAKLSAATKGKVRSPKQVAHLKAIQVARIGTHHIAAARAKMSKAKKGPRHPCWLGGISREPYAWTFNAELKEEVRRRDGYKCQLCGVPQAECKKALPVHHIDYDKKNSDPVNLISLCRTCHSKTNANRKHWTAVFQALAIKRSIKELEGQ